MNSTIYSTLRRREPNGCDEKELVGRVFYASASTEKIGGNEGGGADGGGGGARGSGSCVANNAASAGALADSSENHQFSKTKVRGAVTLLKFAQVGSFPRFLPFLLFNCFLVCFGRQQWVIP